MRDDSYLQQRAEAAESAKAVWRSRAATAAGALISIAILAAMVIWSYRLGVRDANDIPVIQAKADVTKTRPEEPGGIEIAHQGREVYNVIAEAPTTQTASLAPAAETLAAEDAPASTSPAPSPRPAEPAAETVAPAPAPAPEPKPEVAVAAELQPEEAEVASVAPTEAVEPAAAPEPVEAVEEVSALAPRAAPQALPRPVKTVSAAPAAEAEPRAAALASRVQIQLGAFGTEEIAAEQWTALKSRNGDLLSGRGRVVTPVVSGGRRLFRLRAGPFSSVDEASALCRALLARGEACIVARAR